MTLLIRGKRGTSLFFVVTMLLAAAGCGGLTSAGLPTSATQIKNGGSGSNGVNTGAMQATLSSTSVSFGNVAVGTTTTQKVQVTNNGTRDVTITENAASGAGFTASGIGSGLIVNPGQLATLVISFTPANAGQVSGTVPLLSDAWDTPMVITLSGTGIEPASETHAASLAWEPGASVAAGYNAYRGAQSGGPYTKLNSLPLSSTSYADTTVASGQDYFYVVTSVNVLGMESDYSNEVSAAIP